MPVRKIGLCYRSVAGRVPMGAGRVGVDVESTLERDFALLQRFDPAVRSVEGQPVRIRVPGGEGRAGHYVPDFLVTYHDPSRAPWLVEVKYAADPALLAGELEARFAAAWSYAGERGWRFSLMTDAEIRTPLLEAARFLLPYLDRALSAERRAGLLDLVGRHQITVQQLADAAGPDRAQTLPDIWTLVARRELVADFSRPLTLSTILRLPTGDAP